MTKPFGCALMMSLAVVTSPMAFAQSGTDAGAAGSTGGVLLSQGVPVVPADETTERKNGEAYLKDTVRDWEVRCIHLADQPDPCQMYQLLVDDAGTPTSEISVFAVDGAQFAAGARVVSPLETALLSGVTFAIDDGLPSQYPFQVCNPNGCIAQIGVTAEQLDAMKRGEAAELSIVPFRAQQTEVSLKVSLAGFTAAYDLLSDEDQ